jgi:hypothetical protein
MLVGAKLQDNINKTGKYLAPCIQKYGQEFTQKFTAISKIAYGIDDLCSQKYNNALFVLVNSKRKSREFNSFLSYFRNHESYIDDYAYDNPIFGNMYMLVIKIPKESYNAYKYFKEGKYSLMYSDDDIEKLISAPNTYNVLTKQKHYKKEFIKVLNKIFNGVSITEDELGNRELDLPISVDIYKEVFE